MRHSVLLSLAFALSVLPCHAAITSVTGADGIAATIDEQSGRYEVRAKEPNWVFAGTLGAAASDVSVQDGQDRLGAFRELSFRWRDRVALRGSIRTYVERPVLLFAITSTEPNSDAAVIRFPRFTEFPKNLHGFSYVNRDFAPSSFALEENATPWLLYDDQAHATVLSPAANYMIASMHGDGKTEIASGLNESVTALPAGFTHLTLMALGVGVNATWDSWGSALTGLQGVQRPGNDADIGLRYLGYWTDHGGEYYYDYDRKLGYAGTLEALVQRYRAEGIPIRYLQLDSWWYYKTYTDPDGRTGKPKNERLPLEEWNRYGGLIKYQAHPSLFPEGLAAFQQRVGLPLIAHNRWIDPASPYHQRYRISGFAALDPDWWREIIGYLSSAQVVTYEQDWLNVIYEHSPELAASPQADAFSDGMARAAQENGLSIQYSMALPRQFLQGTRYGNLTTIRVSGDHFGREKWDTFLYTSRLASALGIWPWCDVFMSRQTDNLLLATLSAGMVGIGDRIGAEDKKNLLHAVRTDGVIVKPDTPLVPLDAMYTAGSRRPMIAAAHTDHGALRTGYVFSYGRAFEVVNVAFTPAQVGVPRDVYVYDARHRTARRLAASDAFTFALGPNETAYFVVSPVARAGIALLGDEGKFVPDGRKRIAALSDEPDRLTATVMFAPLEPSVRLFGYAPRRPSVTAQTGSVGELDFDQRTGRFEVSVSPGPKTGLERPGNDPVRQAIVSLRSR
ncbi:MAG TPA: hypothetical protein VMO54_09080 [Steroidobacteraceae bacterium]|nr:hypothetical protein [Steroidobacteraceae bacterium]